MTERDQPERKTPMRWRRLKRSAVVSLMLVVMAVLTLAIATRNQLRTLRSLRRVSGTNLYVMDYYADYRLQEIYRDGLDVEDVEGSLLETFLPAPLVPVGEKLKEYYVPEPTYRHTEDGAYSCTTVCCRTANGEVLFGRNFDWKHDACLILKIHGRDGASSVAVIDLQYLNLDRRELEQLGLLDRIPLLFAPYYVMDGMNEHGVAVSDMSVDGARPPFDPQKPDVLHSTAMRLILDYAKSTEHAVALLRKYNIHFVETTCHLMIADRKGESVVVEFIDGKLKVLPAKETWQVCTNHRLWDSSEADNDAQCRRYRVASDRLAEMDGRLEANDLLHVMASASVRDWTMWTSVYNLSTGTVAVAYRRQFADAHVDRLAELHE